MAEKAAIWKEKFHELYRENVENHGPLPHPISPTGGLENYPFIVSNEKAFQMVWEQYPEWEPEI